MIRKIKKEDITKVMTIWVKGNFKAHDFIEKDYWLEIYNDVKEKFLNDFDTYVYSDGDDIKGFVSVSKERVIEAIFVKKDNIRQGIGRKLINHIKNIYPTLTITEYEKNIDAILFLTTMGFKNEGIEIDQKRNEKQYIMQYFYSFEE